MGVSAGALSKPPKNRTTGERLARSTRRWCLGNARLLVGVSDFQLGSSSAGAGPSDHWTTAQTSPSFAVRPAAAFAIGELMSEATVKAAS